MSTTLFFERGHTHQMTPRDYKNIPVGGYLDSDDLPAEVVTDLVKRGIAVVAPNPKDAFKVKVKVNGATPSGLTYYADDVLTVPSQLPLASAYNLLDKGLAERAA